MSRFAVLLVTLALWALSPPTVAAGPCCPKKAGESEAAAPRTVAPPVADAAASTRACCVRHGAHGLGHAECTCCFRAPTPLAPERAVQLSAAQAALLPAMVPVPGGLAAATPLGARPDGFVPRPPPRTTGGPRAPPVS